MMAGIPGMFRSEFYVLNTTGPGLLSRTYAENPDLAGSMTVLFPEDVCDETTWHKFGSFGVHLMNGSWRKNGDSSIVDWRVGGSRAASVTCSRKVSASAPRANTPAIRWVRESLPSPASERVPGHFRESQRALSAHGSGILWSTRVQDGQRSPAHFFQL